MGWKWTDARPLAEALYDRFPERHPLEVRFTELHDRVLEIEGFDDDPNASRESHLEAIQMIWYEEWKEDHPDAEDPYDPHR